MHLEDFSLDFSSSSFVIRVNLSRILDHPYSLLLPAAGVFPILDNFYFKQVSSNLILSRVAKITQVT